ncbi:Ldh family oxidoreductase [Pseudonocardia alni]|uniref:Ldh family oxidoreductase n=1 Tax=Pseudonocardia alni TaxID=33907 RepID=UPI00280B7675|nr:Ldh family oxidoreductase [Pseudonocardia alni]
MTPTAPDAREAIVTPSTRLDADLLLSVTTTILRSAGMTDSDADVLADSLVTADATGVSTHGLTRLSPYVAQLRSGQVNPRPAEKELSESTSALLVDADGGFGAPVGIRVLDRLMDKAQDSGVAFGGVTRVAHFGAAAFFTRYAAERGFLALAMSSTSPSVVPFGGRGPRIGNSPMSFAAPGRAAPELVADMAQSMSSRGRIKLFHRERRPLPPGWAVDAHGVPTTDAGAALEGGVLPSGGHKGTALSLIVEMLASGLTGAHLTQDIRHAGFTSAGTPDLTADVTVGNAYLVLDADVFGSAPEVRRRASSIADHVRASEPAEGVEAVLAPGDPERIHAERARTEGIALAAGTVQSIRALADDLGVALPHALAVAA